MYALCCPGPVLELRPHRTEAASSPGRLLHILTHTCFTHSLKYDIFLYSKLVIHEAHKKWAGVDRLGGTPLTLKTFKNNWIGE